MNVIVIARKTTSADHITAGILHTLARPAVGDRTTKSTLGRFSLTVHKASIRHPVAASVGLAIISLAGVGRCDGQSSLVHRQRTIHIVDVIVAAGQATGADHISASIIRTLARAAVGDCSTKSTLGRLCLAVHKTAVANSISAAESLPIVSLAGVCCSDSKCSLVNSCAMRGICQDIV